MAIQQRELGEIVPRGYSQTLDCMNKPKSWDVPGMIADMAENLRVGNDVSPGQLLAALDWMTFRLKEAKQALSGVNLTEETALLIEKLRGY